ncbi:hypothetical protein ATK78_4568 [Pedobacter metabolipauper]|uniref:Uncharacterized protein n=1 Tax=Pedobacter metabolipauper TaxID=425513 RepID=A0A4R6SQ18_9SPHI|nr:hypothetical protein ATK78_4568 [Pedobacter metabolipauper]
MSVYTCYTFGPALPSYFYLMPDHAIRRSSEFLTVHRKAPVEKVPCSRLRKIRVLKSTARFLIAGFMNRPAVFFTTGLPLFTLNFYLDYRIDYAGLVHRIAGICVGKIIKKECKY